jgi:hypothetical protein
MGSWCLWDQCHCSRKVKHDVGQTNDREKLRRNSMDRLPFLCCAALPGPPASLYPSLPQINSGKGKGWGRTGVWVPLTLASGPCTY